MGFYYGLGARISPQPLYGLEGEQLSSLPGSDLNFVFYP